MISRGIPRSDEVIIHHWRQREHIPKYLAYLPVLSSYLTFKTGWAGKKKARRNVTKQGKRGESSIDVSAGDGETRDDADTKT